MELVVTDHVFRNVASTRLEVVVSYDYLMKEILSEGWILGVFGYRFIQGILFKEWQEIAILRLERAAHQMDMKLHEQMEWMEAFARAGKDR